MKKAIFLDRDGVINQERKDYVKQLSEFIIFDGVGDAIKLLKDLGYLVIIITNQSAINRGLLSIKTLNAIHNYFKEYLKIFNTSIDEIYYCPHKPEENCSCRKPKPGLLLKAKKDFLIDMKNSWMIGDSQSDAEAAKFAGCNYIQLPEGQNLLNLIKMTKNNFVDFKNGG